MSDTPLPPPPSVGGQPPTAPPPAPPTAPSSRLSPPTPPGATAPPTPGSAAVPPAAAEPSVRWKPVAAVAGSALGGALVAFLISWAVIGNDATWNQLPASSNGAAAQGQVPAQDQMPGYGPGRESQSGSGAQSGSGSTGQAPSGAVPSARSGAS